MRVDEAVALDVARAAVATALRCGATACDATLTSARRFHVEARATTLEKLEGAVGTQLHVRVFREGRRAAFATTDLTSEGIEAGVATVVAQAAQVAVDPMAALPERFAERLPELDLFDPAVARRDDAAKIDAALELERIARAADPRIQNSAGSHVGDSVALTALANSSGFAGAYVATRVSMSAGPIAIDDGQKRVGHYGSAARRLDALEAVESVARTAARRATEMFGARKPVTARLPVIFERDVAAAVLSDLFAALSGANVAAGNSWLAGRIGERIGSPAVTVIDDGRLPGGLGSAPFDGEGVATQRTLPFEAGVLRTFLYDTYYARKLGAASTGNAGGGGVAPSNFYLAPGDRSLDELVASTARGVLVMDVIGFATEHASGTYSRGARGFYIVDGEIAYPVDEFTIAGRFAEMLAAVDGVANDLRFDGSVVSPSFRIAEMTVSGT